MKNTQTPISNNIGNQEMNTCDRNDCSSGCLTSNLTPLFNKSPTRPRSRKVAAVLTFLPSCVVATMLRSSMVASLMWPAFTSLMKSEYAIGVAPDARLRLSNCLKTINSTRAITTQIAALENMLFTRTPPTRARLITLYISDFTRIHLRLLGNRPSLADVNRLRQTGGET